MNAKKYRIIVILMVVIMALLFSGCGKQKTKVSVRVAVIDTGISTNEFLFCKYRVVIK